MTEVPARRPEQPPEWSPREERYWDPRDLETELRRTFQVCHECRMCVGYCGSFPILFGAVDREIDAGRAEGAETLDAATFAEVTDHCWQCKLCYIKCPYTEDEGAAELLDFPRLMAREKAQRARRDGIPLVDRILGEPELIGSLAAGPSAGRRESREREPPRAEGRGEGHRDLGRVSLAPDRDRAVLEVDGERTCRCRAPALVARSCSIRRVTAATISPRCRAPPFAFSSGTDTR